MNEMRIILDIPDNQLNCDHKFVFSEMLCKKCKMNVYVYHLINEDENKRSYKVVNPCSSS